MEEPFDNRPGAIWYDGEMVPWQDAKLHVLNHALHYASAVFEGIRCYGSNIFELRQHGAFVRGCEDDGFRNPVFCRRD